MVIGELARYSSWALARRLKGWRGSRTWRDAHFSTAGKLTGLLRASGAHRVEARYGLYLPAWDLPVLVAHADAVERVGRRLGPLGAGFVVARGEPATALTGCGSH